MAVVPKMSVLQGMKTVLVIGASSGIGETFARQFHAEGKTVIITGRRIDRLEAIAKELKTRVHTVQWDISRLDQVTPMSQEILRRFPDINSVFAVSGLCDTTNFYEPTSAEDEAAIVNIMNVNLTSQTLLARTFVPFLRDVAARDEPASYLFMGSGIGFVPFPLYPLYSVTKAGIHALAVTVRQQLNARGDDVVKRNLHIVEMAAPRTSTDFDAGIRGRFNITAPAITLEELLTESMRQLRTAPEPGQQMKEVAVGTAKTRCDLWRDSIGAHLAKINMDG